MLYLPVLARKPGALRNGAPFREWELPTPIRRVQRKLERQPGGDRQMVDIPGAILKRFAFDLNRNSLPLPSVERNL